ncbi:MAG: hypothetical protein J3K34DRAFT_385605 [Monoraphidium minutum]|nr:MAG: hypothetical protein J3K34DRAFT_385605 [Monoraphidium minutum]
MNAAKQVNINSISRGEYRQVVLVGDGFDTRPFRLPWPPGTLLFVAAPAEAHERAEALLAGAEGGPPRVGRGCLLRRVDLNLDAAAVALERAGFRQDRLSLWALQGLHGQRLGRPALLELLADVTNSAAFHSLVIGELPLDGPRSEVDDALAEVGLLGCADEAAEAAAAEVLAAARAGDGDVAARWLFTSQQMRLSLGQMGIYEDHAAAAEETDEDFFGHFS